MRRPVCGSGPGGLSLVVGPPRSPRHYAALRAGSSYGPALRSSGAFRPPAVRPLRVRRSLPGAASAPCARLPLMAHQIRILWSWVRLTVGGWPSYVPVFRCAPHRTSYGHAGAGRGVVWWDGPRRCAPRAPEVGPPSGRPPRARPVVCEAASAPCVEWLMESQSQLRLRRTGSENAGGVGPAGVGAGWGFTPWWLSPVGSFSSPGTGGDQEPVGGATGGSVRGC